MKKTYFFPLALTTLMLGACSSEDGLNLGGGGSVAPGEKGYVSFAIKMPTQPTASVRANDLFDDGDAAEYNVKDAVLLTFTGANEANATFSGAYKLNLGTAEKIEADQNVTATYKLVQEINKPAAAGQNVYALVVLNGIKGGVLSVSDATAPAVATCSIKGSPVAVGTKLADLKGTKYQLSSTDLAKIAKNSTTATDGCFLMSNAVLSNKPGGATAPTGAEVTTLTVIDPTHIYESQTEAQASPAANIYVERAVAKVTVTKGANANGSVTGGGPLTGYEITGWDLDVTNKSGYLVRSTQSTWWPLQFGSAYRMVGSAVVGTNTDNENLFRTYWGEDPNYNGSITVADHFNIASGTTPTLANKVGGNDYCLENTFSLGNMQEDQTTRVIVGAKLTVTGQDGTSKDFYTIDDVKSTIYGKTAVEDYVKSLVLNDAGVMKTIEDALAGAQTFGGSDLSVTFDATKLASGGYVTVTDITVVESSKSKFDNSEVPDVLTDGTDDNNALLAQVNAHKYGYYKGGVAYYPVKIRHFADGEVKPWGQGYTSYDNEANFLGRWGVLRNNWYNIEISGVKTIGSPEVPEVYPTPDDPSEAWLSVEINVLSWAKRTQSAEL